MALSRHTDEPYRQECGCRVFVTDAGAIAGYRQEDQSPVYTERIIIEPCHTHEDHEHGIWRKAEASE